jgi:hypothetical protein
VGIDKFSGIASHGKPLWLRFKILERESLTGSQTKGTLINARSCGEKGGKHAAEQALDESVRARTGLSLTISIVRASRTEEKGTEAPPRGRAKSRKPWRRGHAGGQATWGLASFQTFGWPPTLLRQAAAGQRAGGREESARAKSRSRPRYSTPAPPTEEGGGNRGRRCTVSAKPGA